MSTTSTVQPGTKNPPAEQFWKRYSPHYEAPISGIGSIVIHLIPFALLAAFFILGISFTNNSKIPFQVVKIGGDGKPKGGPGDNPADNGNPQIGDADDQFEGVMPLNVGPPLTGTRLAEAKKLFENDLQGMRYINNPNFEAMARNMDREILARTLAGMTPGKGPMGPGDRRGPGNGPGTGNIKAPIINERVERSLRWVLVFKTHNPNDYVKQLAGLGSILAIPTGANQYQLIKDLNTRPAKLVSEDVTNLDRIYWFDEDPKSVAAVMQLLDVQARPRHFVAFMPRELEEKLVELERNYQGLPEDRIHETRFKVFRGSNGYDVRVIHQTRK